MPGTIQGLEGGGMLFSIGAFILEVEKHTQLKKKKKQYNDIEK